jgi:transposase
MVDGAKPEELAKTLDINLRTIYTWLAKYHYGGEAALKTQPKSGRPPKLNGEQLARLVHLVREHNPLQLKFPYALWTLKMVRELIRREFSVALSEVSVGRLLRRLGMSPQRPLHRAIEQNPVLVDRWRQEQFPAIQREAANLHALIMFADESGIRTDDHRGTTWGQVGQTPIVPRLGARYRINLLSAITAQGEMRFMLHEGRVTAATFYEFLRRLVVGMDRPIVVIVDGHSIHGSKQVQPLLKDYEGKLKLFPLPPNSPQLNPDEWVWNNMKHRVAKQFINSREQLLEVTRQALTTLQNMPKTIRGFFQDPDIRYAAV